MNKSLEGYLYRAFIGFCSIKIGMHIMKKYNVKKFKSSYGWLFKISVKVGLLCPVQQPRLYWDRSTSFVTCEVRTHIEVTACD